MRGGDAGGGLVRRRAGFSCTSTDERFAKWDPPSGGYADVGVCNSVNVGTRNPKSCSGIYQVYQWNAAMQRPVLVLQIHNGGVGVWTAIRNGYTATQNWCANNSFTCAVVTSVGVSLAGGWIKAAIG